jgi:hypothetical protein
MTGAIFTASGRVPKIGITVNVEDLGDWGWELGLMDLG